MEPVDGVLKRDAAERGRHCEGLQLCGEVCDLVRSEHRRVVAAAAALVHRGRRTAGSRVLCPLVRISWPCAMARREMRRLGSGRVVSEELHGATDVEDLGRAGGWDELGYVPRLQMAPRRP